ncbi:MFS transporter [Alteraurantiacibacter aestuarii]|uniref:MFS transporter n=1 Tax=Alteraurantiacibacter aestuarii TaxID=650004 RepID=A0A844ZPH6_9SPHN|nr:MFS transporter [Alteraurantiacibacter aestuarii]MXO88707.1 MFS transporter [Alteraurantiacibacter aestuarii]
MNNAGRDTRQSTRFMLLYALAAAGGATAYVPFLTVLLPVRVADLAGAQDIAWLAYVAFFGAIASSLSNIGFGWLSDITGNRRGWIACGMVLSCALLLCVTQVQDLTGLIAVIVVWQLCLNMMLAPLTAWAGDCVPDRQKGLLGGLLSFSPALGALAGVVVTHPGMASDDVRLMLVAAMVVGCVSPVLIMGAPRRFPELNQPSAIDQTPRKARDWAALTPAIRMWIARLLMQISEAALFAYLYFWFRSISPGFGDNDVARVFGLVLLVSVPFSLLCGRWVDRHNRPNLPLVVGAALSAVGLLTMAAAQDLVLAIAGYVLFGIASAIFLALHSAQTLRVLPRPEHRGRDLGIFNLTNTVPSLIMPGLTLAMVPLFGFSGLFVLLTALAVVAGLLLVALPRPK